MIEFEMELNCYIKVRVFAEHQKDFGNNISLMTFHIPIAAFSVTRHPVKGV